MINTHFLFATPVIESKIIIQTDLLNEIRSFCKKKIAEETYISLRNGYQEHSNFDGEKKLFEILNIFLKNFFKLEIKNGWLNIINKNGFNVPHNHSGQDVTHSGVFYLTSNNSSITFIKDVEIYSFNPKLFDILIFPCNLIHQVSPNVDENQRISYAFNLCKINE
jgi:hypothetical protein